MRVDHKFNIGDKVFLSDDEKGWYVTGVNSKIGYDMLLWEYNLTRATYGDYDIGFFGGRCDVDRKSCVPEDSLDTELEFTANRADALQDEAKEKRG